MDVFFVYFPCTKKNQYSPMNKEHIQNTWCVRRSDAWNVHQVFCKYQHVLYYVFPVITALQRRILMFFFAHTEHTKNTSMCSGENTGGRFNNAYELLNLRALKISMLYKSHIFQCMGKIFCVEFQRVPLKFHTKYLTHTLKDESFMKHLNFKSS